MKVCFTFVGPLKYRGRLFKQIKTLQEAGHECVLIHGQTESIQPDYTVYDFEVIPVRVYQERFKALTLASQLLFSVKAAKIIQEMGCEYVVCVALQSALSGAIAKSRNASLVFIFDNNELSLEMIESGVKRKIWSFFHAHILKHADVIMHAEKQRLAYFHDTYATNAQPFLLENLPFRGAPAAPKKRDGRTIRCLYIGMLMPGRFCEEVLTAFSEIELAGVRLDMVGFYGRASYETTIQKLLQRIDTSRLRILPPVSHNDLYAFLENYDIGLAFYKNTNLNNYFCAPNKVYDYIKMGLPIITNDYPGLVDVVERNRIGVCVPDIDRHHMEAAIKRIEAEDMYANITGKIRERYTWENQAGGYLDLFNPH